MCFVCIWSQSAWLFNSLLHISFFMEIDWWCSMNQSIAAETKGLKIMEPFYKYVYYLNNRNREMALKDIKHRRKQWRSIWKNGDGSGKETWESWDLGFSSTYLFDPLGVRNSWSSAVMVWWGEICMIPEEQRRISHNPVCHLALLLCRTVLVTTSYHAAT